jgi:hypothetical protein
MAALMGAGTFGVHQLRFMIAGGHGATDPRAVEAHAYLVPLGPVVAGLLLLALAAALARVARGAADPVPRLRRLWAGAGASLFAVYCAQETIEAALTGSHPSAWSAAALGHGGWVALPLAIAVGFAIALVMRGVAEATALVARSPLTFSTTAPAFEALLPPWAPRRGSAAARNLAARGPPLASV